MLSAALTVTQPRYSLARENRHGGGPERAAWRQSGLAEFRAIAEILSARGLIVLAPLA